MYSDRHFFPFIFYVLFLINNIQFVQCNTIIPTIEDCGRISISTKIIGGKAVKYGKFPWFFALGQPGNIRFESICGGSIVSSRYGLTAAHCVEVDYASHIRVGEIDVDTDFDGALHEDYVIVEKILHPDYNITTTENDIALVLVDRPIRYNEYIYPGCLPFGFEDQLFYNKKVMVIGRGIKDADLRVPSPVTYGVRVSVLFPERCDEALVYAALVELNHNTTICAGSKRRNSCQGDSGGPLMYLDPKSGKQIIIGIVSFTICGTDSTPGVYTRVTSYNDWLQQTIKKGSS